MRSPILTGLTAMSQMREARRLLRPRVPEGCARDYSLSG